MNWHMFVNTLIGCALVFGLGCGAWLIADCLVYGKRFRGCIGLVLIALFFSAFIGWIT